MLKPTSYLRLIIGLLLTALFPLTYAAQQVFNTSENEARPSATPERVVYLIGDAGEIEGDTPSAMNILRPLLAEEPESSVIFLGDNIYPRGLHGKKSELRAQDVARLEAQMKPLKDHAGKVIFIPGNHDWDQGHADGLKNIKRQQKMVEDYLGEDDNFMPDKGCPGPKVEKMGDLTLIAIDTQWWLHNHEKSIGEADGCSVLDPAGFMIEFKEALKKNRNKHVLVVGHHPIMSNGEHGGRFPLRDHIFPLTHVNDKAYVPLPVIGSIYPLYRSVLGDRQDIRHPVYTEMANALKAAIAEYENVVYAAGHEHNMQYFNYENNHLVVSGSGCKVTHLANSKQMEFGAERVGLVRLSYYDNGDVWLEYIATTADGASEVLSSKKIYNKKPIALTNEIKDPKSYDGMTAMVVGDSAYYNKGIKKLLMGELNRPLWLQPIEVPYLDIHTRKGGLTPIKEGGGMQSKSIRLQGGDGHQYVLRQIKKNSTFLVAKELRNTFAQSTIYDGIAGSHPYASIVIPRLSAPLSIYHTNPELVYLPEDPILGDLQADFGGTFCLFEERPDKDMSHLASVGNAKQVLGYGDMVEKVHEKSKHRVDQRFTLRNRLFDMLIGDWDRHDDQWRWASFKEDGITHYRPIPRDRDQAFFKFDGLIPSIANRKWVLRKFQKFGPEIRDIRGQNFNARYFDRSWLTQLSREDWIEEARYIQNNLSDEDIDAAIALFPQTAQDYNGEFLRSSLKARRDDMLSIADRYYEVLAKSVNVVGKMSDDYFEVIRYEDGSVEVNISPEKDGAIQSDKIYYSRLFKRDETKEIILYGLDGKDVYHISGDVKKSILIRIVAGEEKDKVQDDSRVAGLKKMTRYYDDQGDNDYGNSSELKTSFRSDLNALQYDRKDFEYDSYMPLPYFGFNPDDGVFLGGGITWQSQGFDKPGFKSKQTFTGNYALKTGAFNLEYSGIFRKAIGPFDFGIDASTHQPFIFQYNGAGNETVRIDRDLSRVRLNNIMLKPYLALTNKSGSSMVKLSLHGDNWRYNESEVDEDERSIPITDDTFIGAGLAYSYVSVDNAASPHRGIRFEASVGHSFGQENPLADSLYLTGPMSVFASATDIEFTQFKSELSLYFPLGWMPLKTTLALRGGLQHNEGDFNFYQAAFIGGQNEFRGVRRNRYAGNTAQYNNVDIRMDIKRYKNYILPFKMGVMAHYDLARVWLDGEDSDKWHSSIGGGVYANILSTLTLNAGYSVADNDEGILIVQGKFFF